MRSSFMCVVEELPANSLPPIALQPFSFLKAIAVTYYCIRSFCLYCYQGNHECRRRRSMLGREQKFLDKITELVKQIQQFSGNRKKKVSGTSCYCGTSTPPVYMGHIVPKLYKHVVSLNRKFFMFCSWCIYPSRLNLIKIISFIAILV